MNQAINLLSILGVYAIFLVYPPNIYAQGIELVIQINPGDCQLCVNNVYESYSYLRSRYLGKVYVLEPFSDKDLSSMVLRSKFPELMEEKVNIMNFDSSLSGYNSESKDQLLILNSNGQKIDDMLLSVFIERPDSFLNQFNQQYIDSSLSYFQRVNIVDERYNLFFNTNIYQDSFISIFLNTENYIPNKLWCLNKKNGSVYKFNDINEAYFNMLIRNLKLPGNLEYEQVKKLAKKSRINIIDINNAAYSSKDRLIYGFGDFNFSFDSLDNLMYLPIFFSMDLDFNLLDVIPFKRQIDSSNFYAITTNGLLGTQFYLKDSLIHLKIYDPDYLRGYRAPESKSALNKTLFTSAVFGKSSGKLITFIRYDMPTLLNEEIQNKDFYFNNWSNYIERDNSLYILYYNHPNLLLNVENGKTLKLQTVGSTEKLVYSFSNNQIGFCRIFYLAGKYLMYQYIPEINYTGVYNLGKLYNPTFYQNSNKLYIISFLKNKQIEIRYISMQ